MGNRDGLETIPNNGNSLTEKAKFGVQFKSRLLAALPFLGSHQEVSVWARRQLHGCLARAGDQ